MLERTDPQSPRRAWRVSRTPVVVTVAVIVIVTAGGWALRWWGPINPEVVVDLQPTSDVVAVGGEIPVSITNASRSSVVVEGVDLVAPFSPDDAIRAGTADGPPFELAPGEQAEVLATPSRCEPGSGASVRVEVRVRAAAGRRFVVPGVGNAYLDCPILGLPGVQPAEPAVARSAVVDAYVTAHDQTLSLEQRGAAIDDTRGLADASAALHAGPYGATVEQMGIAVDDVVFASPERARVAYRLVGTPIPGPVVGEAVLVDGTWRITRGTLCTEMSWAGVTCAP